ncbi:unnamed protein product, partial [Meganyctiphanes norvegica]
MDTTPVTHNVSNNGSKVLMVADTEQFACPSLVQQHCCGASTMDIGLKTFILVTPIRDNSEEKCCRCVQVDSISGPVLHMDVHPSCYFPMTFPHDVPTHVMTFFFRQVGRFTRDVLRVWDYGIMTPTSWYYDHDVDVMGIWDLGKMTLKNLELKGLNANGHIWSGARDVSTLRYQKHLTWFAVQSSCQTESPLSKTGFHVLLILPIKEIGSVVGQKLPHQNCTANHEVINCLEAGLVHRHSAAMQSHDPAPSHAIFSLILEHQWNDLDGKLKYLYSRMNFVDLGGSERMMPLGFGNYGMPNEEAFFMNSDLKTLGNVIHCLADQNYFGQIPYKESRLTHILKDAFGGNSLTLIVCCVLPSPEDFDATFNTLKYGGLARYILNCPAVNMAIQNSARGSLATSTPSVANQRTISRQSTATGPQSSVQQSVGTLHHSTNTNETSVGATEDPTATSLDNEDAFKLQFAALQWQLLVSSAEDLLSEMLNDSSVAPAEKTRIQSWLCMKQEAEECIGTDLANLKLHNVNNRVLEVIEELSERSSSVGAARDADTNTSFDSEESDESSVSSLGEEFYDQLCVLQGCFVTLTDNLVNTAQDIDTHEKVKLYSERRKSEPAMEICGKDEADKEVKPSSRRSSKFSDEITEDNEEKYKEENNDRTEGETQCSNPPTARSINSVSDMIQEVKSSLASHKSNFQQHPKDASISSLSIKSDSETEENFKNRRKSILSRLSQFSNKKSRSDNALVEKAGTPEVDSEIRQLETSSESRRGVVRKVCMELRSAQQRLKQLNQTIRLKEAFIRELIRSGGDAEVTKKKCETKMTRLETEVRRARQMHEQAQKQLQEANEVESPEKGECKGRVESLKKQISHYQKKLATLEKVSAISEQNSTKVSELEASVREMRRQQEELQTCLKEETQRKEQLEQQIIRDQRRINELQENMAAREDGDSRRVSSEWLVQEEERVMQLRETTKQLNQEVIEREEQLKQREWMHKEKVKLQESVADGRSSTNGDTHDQEGKLTERGESDLREEISHLRDARDSLMVRRQKIGRKISKSAGRGVGSGEERRMLELDEAIEAVDAAIEYKNEVICGRTNELKTTAKLLNEDSLMDRLMNLSTEEIRSLLVKYFNKVIDIRIEFRKQEIAFADLENQYDQQSRYISDMKSAYQQASLEMEQRIIAQQRDYQHKISTLLRQFNDDSSGSNVHEFRVREMEQQLFYYKKLSKDLKIKLREYKDEAREERHYQRHNINTLPSSQSSIVEVPKHPVAGPSTAMSRRRPLLPQDPRTIAPLLPKRTRLHAAEQAAKQNPPNTKVTREKRRLIIQSNAE